jgi:hypothetical protein
VLPALLAHLRTSGSGPTASPAGSWGPCKILLLLLPLASHILRSRRGFVQQTDPQRLAPKLVRSFRLPFRAPLTYPSVPGMAMHSAVGRATGGSQRRTATSTCRTSRPRTRVVDTSPCPTVFARRSVRRTWSMGLLVSTTPFLFLLVAYNYAFCSCKPMMSAV